MTENKDELLKCSCWEGYVCDYCSGFKAGKKQALTSEIEFLEMLDKDNAVTVNKDYMFKVKQRIAELKGALLE